MSKKKKDIFEVLYKICNSGTTKQKIARIGTFPKLVDIELTNCCNMRCKMCPTGCGTTNRTSGYMDTRMIERILDELSQYKTPIRLIRWGEPLMHPAIYDIIRRAKELDIAVHLNTNGLMLSPSIAKMLISTGVDSIKVSIQGYDRQSYAVVRGLDHFQQLCEDIRGLVLARGDTKVPRIVVGTTIEQKDKIIDMKEDRKDLEQKRWLKIQLDPVDELYVGDTLDLAEERKPPDVCPEVFDKLSIDWDGKVSACCGDYDNYMVVGDIGNGAVDLKTVWNHSKKLKEYRKKLAEHNYEGLALCQRCARGI